MALHTYTPYEWKNAPDHKTTPLSADNLNHIEEGIANAYQDIAEIYKILFPIGAVYLTIGNTNPSTFFTGTTWTLLSDGYLRNNASAETGGSKNSGSTTLTTNQIPAHNHTGTAQAATAYNTSYLARYNEGAVSGNDYIVSYGASVVGSGTGLQNRLSHSHTLSINNTGGGGGHTHTIEPTYTRVYAWKRTA